MLNTRTVIVTDWSVADAPAEFDARYRAARKRKDGGIDKRFAQGRQLLAEEEALITRLSREFVKRYDENG